MTYMNTNVKILKWREIKARLNAVNPRLYALIDDFNPSDDFDFVNITYRFGQPIMKSGQIQIPISSTQTVPLAELVVPESIRKRLNYSFVPTAILLNKKAEVFYESVDRVMPTKIFSQGAMFGLWEMFDPPPGAFVKHIWSIIAGARSLFMLPKIANQFAHKRLQKDFNLQVYAPNNMLQHHQVFTEIANSDKISNNWEMDVLYFSKKWQEISEENNLNSLKLHHFWLQEAWRQSSNCRNNMSFDMAWELFSKAVTKRNMKPKPLIVNTLKHLLAISDGFYPGYSPATNDDSAPIALLTNAYLNVYNTSTYPIIMEPVHLSKANKPVYYSLQFPTLLEYAPGTHGKNVITDLRELKILSDMLEESLNETVRHFTFFHSEEDSGLGIYNVEDVFKLDPQLNFETNTEKKTTYPTSSPFLKGCIQISLEKDRTTPLPVDAVF